MATPAWQPGTLYQPGDLVRPASSPPPLFTALVNPGFETGDLTGWTGSDANFQVLTNRVFAGAYCARYNGTNTQAAPAYLEQSAYAPTLPGNLINASCQIDQGELNSTPSQAGGWIAIAWYTSSNVLISVTEGNRITSGHGGSWQQSSVAATAPATAAKCKLRVYAYKTVAAGGNNDKPGFDAAVWDQSYVPPTDSVVYEATQAGAATSAAIEPVWPGEGLTVVDGGVTWLGVEASRVTWQATPILVSGATEPAFPAFAGATVLDNTIIWEATTGFISEAPTSKVAMIAASKIFAGDEDIVPYSATVNPLDWTTEQDAGYLPYGIQVYGSNPVAAMGLFRGNLMVFNSEGFQMWQVDEDPALMALLDGAPIGCIYPRSVQSVGNDLFVLTSQGVRNIAIAAASTNLQAGTAGDAVDPLIKTAVETGVTPRSIYFPAMGQYWLAFGATVFVLSMYKRKASWARYVFPEAITDFTLAGDVLYMRTENHLVWKFDDTVLVDDFGTPGDPDFTDVAALLHFNGVQGGQVFPDVIGHTVTTLGMTETAITDTTRKVFGSASISFPSATDSTDVRLLTAGDTRFNLGTRDFTIETRVWRASASLGNKVIFAFADPTGDKYPLTVYLDSANSLVLKVRDAANGFLLDVDLVASLPTDQWVGFALTRSGSTFRMFANGVQVYSGTSAGTIGPLSATGVVLFGRNLPDPANSIYLGNLEEFRFTADLARYTADYDLATEEFPDNYSAGGTNIPFEGVLQWPWLDLGNIGVQKALEGFDLVGSGEVSVSIGYNQKDVNAYTTPYLIADADTLPDEPVPLPLSAPSYSLKLTYSAEQAWEWQAANLYASDNRGGGARG